MKRIFKKIKEFFTIELSLEDNVMYDIPLTITEVKSLYFAIENNDDESLTNIKYMLCAAINHYENEIDI